MSFCVAIPARLGSTRLPGKPLADIAGKPMIVRVAERARASGASRVVVATDAASVRDACAAHGIVAMMTRADHPSGTDRIAEVAIALGLGDEAIVVNVQGDEPLIDPALIDAVAGTLAASPIAAIATASHPIASVEEFRNPNVVKVVAGADGLAHYFSRAPIPWPRDIFAAGADASPDWPTGFSAQRHIGIYAYRVGFLRTYSALPPAPAERVEALEQLRALHHGFRIAVREWRDAIAPGVDTPEDLERVRRLFG